MDKIEELLTRGVQNIIPTKRALEEILRSGKKLRVYQGFDATSPELHIGHLVGLHKLRQWQELGHEVIFLVGDFTGTIGDPTGKEDARPELPLEQTQANGATYKNQIKNILNFSGNNPAKIRANSEWLSKMPINEVAELMHHLTIQQVIERDMFQKRLKSGGNLALSEFFYPLLQGYDSVALDVDVEIGGNDQLFNMMTGRDLMHKIKRKNKFVMTTPLLTDLEGKKIGKTEGNAIALTESPDKMFKDIMELDDSVILTCFECITTVPIESIVVVEHRLKNGENPTVLKKELAHQIVTELHSKAEADYAQEQYVLRYEKNDLVSLSISPSPSPAPPIEIEALVSEAAGVSLSEAKRLLDQNAVKYNGDTQKRGTVFDSEITGILEVGKKTVKRYTIN